MGEENQYYIKDHFNKEKEVYQILCNNKGDIINKFILRINNIITQNSTEKLIKNIENEKEILKSKMNKLIDLSIENAIDRETFFSVVDVVKALIDSNNLKDYWYRLKKRILD